MKYISSDTNIWLDFNAILRIDLPFRLPYTYVMYKEALRREIITPPGLIDDLLRRGLLDIEVTIEEVYYAQDLLSKYIKISGYDSIALAIAKLRNYPLVTGDNSLRKAAEKEGVPVFGTLGLLKRLYESNLIAKEEYAYCLESLLEHKERRLPEDIMFKELEKLKKRTR